ncbi:metallophosphoesterase [Aeoliella sp. ICT_H6.2]|uniref:Metallophosphoesterase n=1 Tax=Aeoliella straminimaris TaxID=2954799 RepID=A0A9X2FGG6_9BACT|nr:metallophosphoesterase [Aeoliella straminimaris]MCO6047692.1 metallophosphoesterase [Aeoliella straminimaris]
MKLHILSDLHLEFESFEIPSVDADVRILAGDIDVRTRGLEFALEQSAIPAIYVAGNHEYYGDALPKLTDKLRQQASGTQVHFLENEVAVFGATRILGCTLWTDFDLCGSEIREIAMLEAKKIMNDYKRIRKSPRYGKVQPATTRSLHLSSLAWLRSELQREWSGQTIVVTHHAPLVQSLDRHKPVELLSAAYASQLDSLIEEFPIHLWIHGHTHHCVDYEWMGTRILSNQRGYPDAPAIGFDAGLVVSI